MPDCSDLIKLTNTSDFAFFKALLMLETCNKLFFVNFAILSSFIGMMTCNNRSQFNVLKIFGNLIHFLLRFGGNGR